MASKAPMSSQRPNSLDEAPRIPARGGCTRIRRFDGLTRRTADWDGLRKDTQLWTDNADCLVYFYGFGTSQRGPSLKVSFEVVEKLSCDYLMHNCLHYPNAHTKAPHISDRSDNTYGPSLSTIDEVEKPIYELYIPAPNDLSRDDAFCYHLATRNVFAYATGQPVVGERLSSALTALWNRLRDWVPKSTSIDDYTSYLEKQGYLNFAQNSEHALACLKFAEDAKARDVWVDAFVHCVGMHDRLYLSPEFPGLSNTTTALITRASLEMDLHIARVVRALSSFLEEELGTEHLGLSKPARDHLDHFRSFLHAFYVDKFGYFPPPENTTWDKRPWKAMHNEFRALYDYLADSDPSSDWASTRAVTGGVCVIQNVQAFDRRHGYEPLPHPLPLLPKAPVRQRHSMSSQKGLRTLKLGRVNSVPEPKITTNQALAIATNCLEGEVMLCQLVQEYQRFERHKLDPKLDAAEARKVRWLLIYSVLQMLNSIMNAPKEVKDSDTPIYPVCVLTSGCPPWVEKAASLVSDDENEDAGRSSGTATLVPQALEALEGRTSSPSRISIHPDCEADCAEDFFASHRGSRRESQVSLNATSTPLKLSTQLARTASIRTSMHSSVQALHKSVVGSLNKRNSIRRESLRPEPRKVRSYCEIVVERYGNGVNAAIENSQAQIIFHTGETPAADVRDPLLDFDFGLAAVNDEPMLENYQLDRRMNGLEIPLHVIADMNRSPCESSFSTTSGDLPDSNRSSYTPESDSDSTDLSSWDGGSEREDAEKSVQSTPVDYTYGSHYATLTKRLCYRPSRPELGVKTMIGTVHGGCYVPSGMIVPPLSRLAHRRNMGDGTIKSGASSTYPDESLQAADIEEEEIRGRRRTRVF